MTSRLGALPMAGIAARLGHGPELVWINNDRLLTGHCKHVYFANWRAARPGLLRRAYSWRWLPGCANSQRQR